MCRVLTTLAVCTIAMPATADLPVRHEVGKLLATDGAANDQFGYDVAIDGTVAIVGARYNDDQGNNSGSAYLFDVTTGAQFSKLLPTGGVAEDEFGISVDLDGDTALVGAWGGERWSYVNAGTAYGFDISNPADPVQCGQIWQLIPNDYDRFGFDVSIQGGQAIVGAPYARIGQPNTGVIYFFETSGWQQTAYTWSPDLSQWDLYGGAVAIDGGRAVVGAQGQAGGRGAVYFERLSPYQQVKAVPADVSAGDLFGYSCAIDGDRALVGAPNHNGRAGAVYVYNPYTAVMIGKVVAPDAAANDLFGFSVALDGDIAVIGSTGDDDAGPGSGSAYVYNINTGEFIMKLVPTDSAAFDELGMSVAIHGETVLVGTRYDDDRGTDSGSVYVFSLAPEPCNDADIAEPFGLHDLADVTVFAAAFLAGDQAADLDDSGLLDLADVVEFITAFNAGCP